MNIIYWSDAGLPSRAANTVHIMKMGQAIAENGHNVTLIARANSKSHKKEEIYDYYGVKHNFQLKLIETSSRHGSGVVYALKGLKYVRTCKPDLVYGRSVYGCFLAAMFTKSPVIIEMHDMLDGNLFFKLLFSIMIHRKNLKKVVVITDGLANSYRSKYSFVSDKIFVAPDGADAVDIKKIGKELPIKKENIRFNIGYIGSLYKGRGIDLILKMAEALPNDIFHIIGGSEREVSEWEKSAKNVDNVVFYGQVSPADVPMYGCCMDILLAPYQNNVYSSHSSNTTDTVNYMSPMKIFEYMSFGKVIIASDLPAIREVLRNEENAILCSPTDGKQWVEAVERLYCENELKTRLEKNSLREFLDKYTWKERARRLF